MERSSRRARKKINYALLAKGEGIGKEMNVANERIPTNRLSVPSSPALIDEEENETKFLNGECSMIEPRDEAQKVVSLTDEASRSSSFEEGGDTESTIVGRRKSAESRELSGECNERSLSRNLPETLLSGRSPRKRTRSVVLSRYDDYDEQLQGNGKRSDDGRSVGGCLAVARKTDRSAQWTLINSVSSTFKEFSLPREWLRRIPKSQVKTRLVGSISSSPNSKDRKSGHNVILSTRSVITDKGLKFNRSDEKVTCAPFSEENSMDHSVNKEGANEKPKDRIATAEASNNKEGEHGQVRLGRRPTRVPAALSEYDLGRHPLLPTISRNATMVKANLGDWSERLSMSSESNPRRVRRNDNSESRQFKVRGPAVNNPTGSGRRTVLVDAGIPRKKPSFAIAVAKTRATRGISADGTYRRGSEGRREHAKAGFYRQLLKSADIGRLNAKKRNTVSLKKSNKNRNAQP